MSDPVIIIPARSKSKRLKNKNILEINDISLIQHALNFALSIPYKSIIFSSDSLAYYQSLDNKNKVFFHQRSAHSSGDNATDFDVIFEIFNQKLIDEKDTILWIRPTSPIRDPIECMDALEYFRKQSDFLSLRSIQEVVDHPYWMKFIDKDGSLIPLIKDKNESIYPNSQSLPKCFFPTCEFEISITKNVLLQKRLICFPSTYYITKKRSIDIDTFEDYQFARFLLEN